MTKSELINRVSRIYPYIHKDNIERIINIILNLMVEKLSQGGRIELRDFGSFGVKLKEQSTGRNPKNGETVIIDPKNVPFFKAGKRLKDLINGRQPRNTNPFLR